MSATKNAVITGGTAGIGKETALAMAAQGYNLILVARNVDKGNQMVARIKQQSPGVMVEFISADMANFAEVKQLAQQIRDKFDQIDALVLNAGLFTTQIKLSDSGHEYMFATTHLGHFLLTHELLPLITKVEDARIVVTSSIAHRFGNLVDFFKIEKPYKLGTFMLFPFLNYGRSKLANILFVRELAKRLANTNVKVNAFHPGAVKTEFYRQTPGLFNSVTMPFMISEAKGAQTQIHLATSDQVKETGQYWYKKKAVPGSSASRQQDLVDKLWEYSEQAVGVRDFGVPA